MNFYRNGEGYYDPTAGAALTAVEKERKQQRRQKAETERQADFEKLCAQFVEAAKARGFEFPGQIWLRDKKTGFVFKK